jgi:hypothetical protein
VTTPEPSPPSLALPQALRDARGIAERVGADEAAADAERLRLVEGELPNLNDEATEALALGSGEVLHATRRAAMLENGAMPFGGSLYLTSERLVHIGQERHEVPLEKIAESAVALERLLLLDLTDGSDLAIEVDQPRLLRVQLAAARANARRHGA